jgi:hypothetical protein
VPDRLVVQRVIVESFRILQVVGCQPRASKVMYESVRAGKQIHEESAPTLSDGTAGGLEEGTVSLRVGEGRKREREREGGERGRERWSERERGGEWERARERGR